jgi:hypothetical protein
VIWREATAYKLALLFTQKLKQTAPLANTYNLENTTDLLKKTPEHRHTLLNFNLASLDISNLYTNIPIKETRRIIDKNLDNNHAEPQTKYELLN